MARALQDRTTLDIQVGGMVVLLILAKSSLELVWDHRPPSDLLAKVLAAVLDRDVIP